MNFYIRVVCLFCASFIAANALSQDMSSWSDKTVCRLLLSKPDMSVFTEESISRGLSCVSTQEKVTKQTSSRTKFYTSFDTAPEYIVPHKYNTTKKAASFKDGVLKLTLDPGMYGTSSDQRGGKERAELGQKNPLLHKVKMSFRFRVADDFEATARTMIAQIKAEYSSPLSPSVAVYANKNGRVKCVDYTKYRDSKKRPSRSISADLYRVSLSDSKWHDVVINFTPSHTDGYCSVDIDGINQIKVEGYDSIPTPEPGKSLGQFRSRIGIYRDAQPFSQTVYFDDWRVKASPVTEEN